MEILKIATDWAKTESFSSAFFVLFGVLFLLASAGFWLMGKTDISRAYVIPMLVAGALLMVIGIGLVYANQVRIAEFPVAYQDDAAAFITSELERVNKVLSEYQAVVFTAIPIIIAICAGLVFLLDAPFWRATMITIIAMMAVILLIDGTAHSRIEIYKEQLLSAASKA